MTFAELDAFCLNLPGCEARYPFESAPDLRAWCIDKRMFAWSVTTKAPLTIQVKANPELVPTLINSYGYISPGYHMNKRHWVTVALGMCEENMLRGLLEDAHALFIAHLPKVRRLSLPGD